jgi:GLPGLI family protein
MDPDTQTIRGFLCKKATAKNRQGGAVVAWYAENIESPSGPEDYGGLPGLILRLDINDGELVFTAEEIDTTLDKGQVQAPANGKKITREAFRKMLEERGAGSAGGPSVIRIIAD